jgi:hypothetical protein
MAIEISQYGNGFTTNENYFDEIKIVDVNDHGYHGQSFIYDESDPLDLDERFPMINQILLWGGIVVILVGIFYNIRRRNLRARDRIPTLVNHLYPDNSKEE